MSISNQILAEGRFDGIFPGWGGSRVVALNCSDEGELKVIADTNGPVDPNYNANKKSHPKHAGLNALLSVSIAGCDLMGSCLYTAGVCTVNAGKLAPICLFLVTTMLYFFRGVYAEIVTAIPVNGGTYNVMLNTSTKKVAAFVACLSILSYVATAIVSAFDSIVYLVLLWPECDIRIATLIVLAGFGAITICGVGESASVAAAMVCVHVSILTILIIWGFVYGCRDGFSTLHANYMEPFPAIISSSHEVLANRNAGSSLYFGYCSALLGITGFETASNYVEELKNPGVFVTTVNIMWVLVGIYNPLISLTSMMVMPLEEIYSHPSEMLAVMAKILGGETFHTIMCVDAVVILCGGVLTSIVGVSGLLKRLAQDKVLPDFLAVTNSRGANYAAIISFVIVAMSLFLAIFDPEDPTAINNFGGVFAISFLSVLVCFAMGAVLVKLYRSKLARMVIAEWWHIIVSFSAVFIGLIGNIILTPTVFSLFLIYLAGFMAVSIYMFSRVEIFGLAIWVIRKMNLSKEKREAAAQNDNKILEACRRQAAYDERRVLLSLDEVQANGTMDGSPHSPDSHHLINGVELTPQGAQGKRRRRAMSVDEESAMAGGGDFEHDESFTSSKLFNWGDKLIANVKKRLTTVMRRNSIDGDSKPKTQSELEVILATKPRVASVLTYLMNSLDGITSAPFVYLAKSSDPLAIHKAISYITNNEVTNHIYVVHFVDDRKAIRMRTAFHSRAKERVQSGQLNEKEIDTFSNTLLMQMFMDDNNLFRATLDEGLPEFNQRSALNALPQEAEKLVNTISVLDAFYTYKKIHCIIVRGGYFCPSALDCLAEFLGVTKNNMIMGVPDTNFPFPFSHLNGVRLAVDAPDPVLSRKAANHMWAVLSEQFQNGGGLGSNSSIFGGGDDDDEPPSSSSSVADNSDRHYSNASSAAEGTRPTERANAGPLRFPLRANGTGSTDSSVVAGALTPQASHKGNGRNGDYMLTSSTGEEDTAVDERVISYHNDLSSPHDV